MAAETAPDAMRPISSSTQANYTLPMALMVCLYFCIGFITALNDILVPHFKELFHLTNTLALLVQFCFFGAYFVMSMPSGAIVGRIGSKPSMIAALCTVAAGLFLFVPASIAISYPLFLLALFIVGSGFALLQVAINPYVSVLGPPERGAWRINICGIFNSSATTIAPKVGAFFIFIAAGATTAELARSVRLPYVIVACFTLLVAFATARVPLPKLIQTVSQSATTKAQRSAWSFRHLRFGAIGIFSSVGSEVAIGSVLIDFLGQPAMGALSHTVAAGYVSLYWGSAMVGRIIGSVALLRVKAQHALLAVSCAAALMVLITIFAHGPIAIWAIVSCGLFNSVMWPCIFPLAVAGLGPSTSQGSGILVTMVVGGAIVPLVQGAIADHLGFQRSFAIVLCCYLYLAFFALNGYKVRQSRFAESPGSIGSAVAAG